MSDTGKPTLTAADILSLLQVHETRRHNAETALLNIVSALVGGSAALAALIGLPDSNYHRAVICLIGILGSLVALSAARIKRAEAHDAKERLAVGQRMIPEFPDDLSLIDESPSGRFPITSVVGVLFATGWVIATSVFAHRADLFNGWF